jgi:hypothetical protein
MHVFKLRKHDDKKCSHEEDSRYAVSLDRKME